MERPVDAFDAGLEIARALEATDVPYAIGGAIAYALWGPPRGTMDVDLNVFVTAEGTPAAAVVLEKAGVVFRPGDLEELAREQGMVIGRFGEFRVDVFIPSIPFSWEAMRTRVRARMRDVDAWFLSAEATCVFKLLFFRTKDKADMERLVAMQRRRLDAPYVRRWTAEMMGEDDERIRFWDETVAAYGGE